MRITRSDPHKAGIWSPNDGRPAPKYGTPTYKGRQAHRLEHHTPRRNEESPRRRPPIQRTHGHPHHKQRHTLRPMQQHPLLQRTKQPIPRLARPQRPNPRRRGRIQRRGPRLGTRRKRPTLGTPRRTPRHEGHLEREQQVLMRNYAEEAPDHMKRRCYDCKFKATSAGGAQTRKPPKNEEQASQAYTTAHTGAQLTGEEANLPGGSGDSRFASEVSVVTGSNFVVTF